MLIRSPPYFFEPLVKDVAHNYSTMNQEIGDMNHA